jgi:hypothetical protein
MPYDTKNTTGAPKPPNTSGSKKQNTPNTSPELQKPKQLPTPPLAPENSKQQNHVKSLFVSTTTKRKLDPSPPPPRKLKPDPSPPKHRRNTIRLNHPQTGTEQLRPTTTKHADARQRRDMILNNHKTKQKQPEQKTTEQSNNGSSEMADLKRNKVVRRAACVTHHTTF